MSAAERVPRIRLSFSGQYAELTRDDLTEAGVVLSTGSGPGGMAEQSHVEVGDPGYLLHDYTHRMSSVLRAAAGRLWGSGEGGADPRPASALHLGAGALTLPRWVEDRWPGCRQTVVDIEPELVDFVLEHVPMANPPESVVADAARVLGSGGALAGRAFDVVIVDLFNSADAPASLTYPEFFAQVCRALTPRGLLLMNLGDDAGMEFARALSGTLLDAVGSSAGAAGAAEHALLTAPDAVLSAREEGNLVFAATPAAPFTDFERQLIWAAGPHPGDVLSDAELRSWAG